ncbi:MAG: HRDC domain-containing protein [Candidatus Moduliflexus flocculans]|nr:HRDC domain-containing protein [Candidatus Moduliflexus flocculans]
MIRELFETLRQKRRELAQAAKIPPYVIFSDKTTCRDVCHFPRTAEEMLRIHGMGRAAR